MAQLLIRKLDDDVKARLKARAKTHGRSLEAEVRDVLEKAVAGDATGGAKAEGFGTALARKMAEIGVTKADGEALDRAITENRKSWRIRPVEFD